ncbi:MAG: ATP-grasp domain-containing protein [Desulfobacterales bacterium]
MKLKKYYKRVLKMVEIHFSNYCLKENTYYFLYIGELKNYGLNLFLKDALSRIKDRKIDFISIVPDVFEQYNYENLIVINPDAKNFRNKYGHNVSCRISARKFLTCVSESQQIKDLVRKLLDRQDNLYLYLYESMPEMTLDSIPGVFILGPESKIAGRLNSKIYQYKNLKGLIPVADFFICDGMDDLIRTTDRLWPQWKDGIFVSLEYSAAGSNSIIASSPRDILAKFFGQEATYLISRNIPHKHDPTVLAVVANEDAIYIAGVADQRIENGTRFTGSTFPTKLGNEIVAGLKKQTRTVGKWLARKGYRGIYGCDFLVDDNGEVIFLEVNARKQGTTMEFCCTLEQSLPSDSPMLPELEYYAVIHGKFPENTIELKKNIKNINWGTYNYKIDKTVFTQGYIPQNSHEREAFKKVADNNLNKDYVILEHIGNDFVVEEGSFLGRIVALGHDHSSIQQGLNQGRKIIELTIVK